MSTPWYDPNLFGWIPGTAFGLLAGTWGGCAGILAPRGLAKGLVLGGYWGLLGISVISLIAGIAALSTGQPYGVWYGLLLPGVIGGFVCGSCYPAYRQIQNVYRQAEERKMSAADLS